eukprot:15390494-Heterocapsa_arctica.AAC.1
MFLPPQVAVDRAFGELAVEPEDCRIVLHYAPRQCPHNGERGSGVVVLGGSLGFESHAVEKLAAVFCDDGSRSSLEGEYQGSLHGFDSQACLEAVAAIDGRSLGIVR